MDAKKEFKKRDGDKLIHQKFPVRKKFAVPIYIIGMFLAGLGWFFTEGWLPWASANALEKHTAQDRLSWTEDLKKSEAIKKNESERMRNEMEGMKLTQRVQSEKIQQVQVQVGKMQSDVGHIMTGITDIKSMMRQDRRVNR